VGDDFEPAAFARDFATFLANVNRLTKQGPAPLPALLRDHLGHDPADLPAVAEQLQPAEHPNLQAALDELTGGDGTWRVVGLPLGLRTFAGFSLATVATDRPKPICGPSRSTRSASPPRPRSSGRPAGTSSGACCCTARPARARPCRSPTCATACPTAPPS
jgi:hypothetical protein